MTIRELKVDQLVPNPSIAMIAKRGRCVTSDLAGNNLPIREFKLDWMAPNSTSTIVMIAKRNSGMDWRIRDIIKFD